jgi:hypothetical protein
LLLVTIITCLTASPCSRRYHGGSPSWKDIGFDPSLIQHYNFDAIYDGGTGAEIEFGEFKGRKKFERVLAIPTQDMCDSLLHLIFYQGDTEFGSSEQQRKLLDIAPSE